MILQFDTQTALLLIDVQKGVNDLEYYGGGPGGQRNNPAAEDNQRRLLNTWRERDGSVAFTMHDSREAGSPLKLALPTGEQIEGLEPRDGEITVVKDVNSGFIGTSLALALRRADIRRLVVAGFFTNFCVETTTRMAGNMGFDVYLVEDACAAATRVGPDGTRYDADLVHRLSIANLHGEFCTAISTTEALALMAGDAPRLERVQGNE